LDLGQTIYNTFGCNHQEKQKSCSYIAPTTETESVVGALLSGGR
jgi:hypothetical protein